MTKVAARSITLSLLLWMAAASAPAAARQPAPDTSGAQQEARTIRVKILGMSCPFCAYGVEQKLKKLDGVKGLEVELESGVATLTMREGADLSNETLRETVDEAGFEAAAVVRSFNSEYEDWNPEELLGAEGPGERSGRSSPGRT